MIAYAASEANPRSHAALLRAGWRTLLSPVRPAKLQPRGLQYALDNGAWSAFSIGLPWDGDKYRKALRSLGADADWVVLPDIVSGGMASLELSMGWVQEALDYSQRVLLPVQDGMDAKSVEGLLGNRVGVFVGGSTPFKEGTMAMWGQMAHRCGAWCHIGRVNTARRIRLCAAAGADSFDGSSVTRYAVTLPELDVARWQRDLFAPGTLMTEDDMEEFQ